MPKFEVVIVKTETIESTLSLEMTAKDEEAAEAKAQALLADERRLAQVMQHQNVDWEEADNAMDVEIESVSAL